MSVDFLKTPIEYLKGVGPERAKTLQSELNIFRYEDLLNYFPFRHVDRSKYYKINEILPSSLAEIQIVGRIRNISEIGQGKGKRLTAKFEDETGELELVWFRYTKWLKETIENSVGKPILIYGKPNEFNRKINIVHPEMETLENHKNSPQGLFPVYSSTEKLQKKGISNRVMQKLQFQLLSEIQSLNENLSSEILSKFNFPKRLEAYRQIHFPKNSEELKQAENRLKFEEFFFLQLGLLIKKLNHQSKFKSYSFESIGDNFNDFYKHHLPFE